MAYWLVKSDPEEYGIQHLKKEVLTLWTGVRNYQARNHLQAMQVGDEVLFYHSQDKPPAVAGVAKVSKVAVADPTQFEAANKHFDPDSPKDKPRWVAPELKFDRQFPRSIGLPLIKKQKPLANMLLLKSHRLSVQPVSEEEYRLIIQLSESQGRGKNSDQKQ